MGFKTRLALAVVVLLAVVFHAYVRIFATVAYTYIYWGILPKSINWVDAARETRARKGEIDLPVPKLIHQTWVDEHVPEKWQAAQQSCIDAHAAGNYTYKLWTDQQGLELIRDEYPWFLPTYEAYPYSIQRVDAVRYFILHKYGGIYIDLDMGCNRELTFMREHGFTAPLTYPVGISNDVMAAQPGNAYLERVIHRLQYWNHWLFIKYVQVMFSTVRSILTIDIKHPG
jgi:inositol phosphorylceramide mannosyltransferase catalytic subunit